MNLFMFLRFAPKIWDSLHAHGLNDFTQTGCKLAMFTMVGIPHVVSFLVLLSVICASKTLMSTDAAAQVDNGVRKRI
jgi:hypothetical protein